MFFGTEIGLIIEDRVQMVGPNISRLIQWREFRYIAIVVLIHCLTSL